MTYDITYYNISMLSLLITQYHRLLARTASPCSVLFAVFLHVITPHFSVDMYLCVVCSSCKIFYIFIIQFACPNLLGTEMVLL